MKIDEIIESIAEEKAFFHAYLFVGGDRLMHGKIASHIIDKLNCAKADISIVEPADGSGKAGEIKTEQIRNLIHELTLTAYGSGRVAIIYQAERLNQSSSNSLLKTLEEPNGNAVILLFSQKDTMLATIKSRCRVVRIQSVEEVNEDEFNISGMLSDSFIENSNQIEKIIKDAKIDEFLDELRISLRAKMIQKIDIKYVRLLKKLEKTRREIRANANSRLALEALILIIKEISKNEK
ncbi:MAG: hypothetical protein WCO23_03780 [bacterium]